jgi:hypothetical protein
VQVFDKSGQYLATMHVPRRPEPRVRRTRRTLYITAREGLYRIETLTCGAERLGK